MANALSAYNTHVVFYRAFYLTGHAVLYTLINMANALSVHNAHVVFYIAFHSACCVIYINKHG